MKYGMSERLGPILYDTSGHSIFIGRDFGQTKSYSEETAAIIDEEVKAIFDEAAKRCEAILTEHGEQLRGLAEYLLVNETIEADEFNYYFEHGEFMPEVLKAGKQARHDSTIERPAKKISMTDGYAEEQKTEEEEAPDSVSATETPEAEAPAFETPFAYHVAVFRRDGAFALRRNDVKLTRGCPAATAFISVSPQRVLPRVVETVHLAALIFYATGFDSPFTSAFSACRSNSAVSTTSFVTGSSLVTSRIPCM